MLTYLYLKNMNRNFATDIGKYCRLEKIEYEHLLSGLRSQAAKKPPCSERNKTNTQHKFQRLRTVN